MENKKLKDWLCKSFVFLKPSPKHLQLNQDSIKNIWELSWAEQSKTKKSKFSD